MDRSRDHIAGSPSPGSHTSTGRRRTAMFHRPPMAIRTALSCVGTGSRAIHVNVSSALRAQNAKHTHPQ